jgi:uncharacterized protein
MAPKTKRKTKKIDMSSQPAPTVGGPPMVTSELVEVRNSPVHGRGVFAVKPIAKGARIIEYIGDRISHAAADKRYEDHDENDNHTFLFIVDKKTVIDAGVGGNDARFINHQCEGNCESVIKYRRVFINATRAIAPGEELGYDYEIGREKDDPENVDEIYACRCGSPKCRGTMLWPAKRPEPKAKKKTSRSSKAGKKARPRSAEQPRRAAHSRADKSRAGKSRKPRKADRRGERSRRRA